MTVYVLHSQCQMFILNSGLALQCFCTINFSKSKKYKADKTHSYEMSCNLLKKCFLNTINLNVDFLCVLFFVSNDEAMLNLKYMKCLPYMKIT